jgi:hypothetical protein
MTKPPPDERDLTSLSYFFKPDKDISAFNISASMPAIKVSFGRSLLSHMYLNEFTLPASLLMGLIWKTSGVEWAFSFGAMMALIAALLAIVLMEDDERKV